MRFFRNPTPKQQMHTLLVGVLLSHLGTYMVLPILPIFLKVQKEMTIAEIGMILAVSPFTFQIGSLLGGVLADRIGRRSVIAIGAWINAVALTGYAFIDSFWLFVGVGLISGFGIGLNAPSTKAALSVLASTDTNKTSAFSLRGIAANAGIAIAGLLTYFILGGSSVFVFYVAAALYILLGIISWALLPKGCGDAPCEVVPLKSYLTIFQNKAFVVFSIVTIFVWAIYTQFSLSLPLRGETILSDAGLVSLIWTINSLLVIVLQTPISRWFIQKIHPMFALSLGMLFIGGGLGSLYWSTSFSWLVLSGAIFVIGEMLIVPTMDTTISKLGTAKMIGVFFGLSNFVSGLGEGTGKFTGGQLLSMGIDSPTPWIIYALGAIIVSLALAGLRFWHPLRHALGEQKEMKKDSNKFHTLENQYASMYDWFLGRRKRFE